jgi:uncharacterized protein YdaU (DUF1376 family)
MSVPSMPLFCGDYLADTKHLTLEQHGAYCLLLMITWRNSGRALPDDDTLLSRYLSITKDRWQKKIRPALEPLFDLSGGTWRSTRLDREWDYVQRKIAAQRENGALGGRPKKHSPENGPNSGAPTRENFSKSADANPLNENETAKPNGFDRRNPNETTHPPSSSAYAEKEEEDDAGAPEAVLQQVTERVAGMAGISGKGALERNATIAAGWLKDGADPNADIYPAVAAAMNRTQQTRIRGFSYFTDEIKTQQRARLTPKQEISNVRHIHHGTGKKQSGEGSLISRYALGLA